MTHYTSSAERTSWMARLGSAEDVANAVVFLVSPQSAYITGETLHVNDGMYMP